MRMSRACAFLAVALGLSTPACETIPIGSDRSDGGPNGPAASDADAADPHNCHEPGYVCPGNQICKPLQLGGWWCFPPGVDP